MSIVTKTGDSGETGLIGGSRVSKNSPFMHAIGSVDELNASVGVLRTFKNDTQTKKIFEQIQNDLFVVGAELADPGKKSSHTPHITASHVHFLEERIYAIEKKLPPLRNFILPTGTPFAAHLHLARAICRRAERWVTGLHTGKKTNEVAEPRLGLTIKYLNRLSDLLFVLAREDMKLSKKKETIWKASSPPICPS